MNWSKTIIFFAGLLLCLTLCGGIHGWQAKSFFLDRIYLDEVFSGAAKDACEASFPEPEPEPVWERFLTACGASLSGEGWKEAIEGAFITTERGYYPYERRSGWGGLVRWKPDSAGITRAEQLALRFPSCTFPQEELAEWESGFPANCLVVMYREEAGEDPEGLYLRAAVGGARVMKKKPFYVTETGGVRYYHREGCPLLSGEGETAGTGVGGLAGGNRAHGDIGEETKIEKYYSMKECAESGAWPCRSCTEEGN